MGSSRGEAAKLPPAAHDHARANREIERDRDIRFTSERQRLGICSLYNTHWHCSLTDADPIDRNF